MRGRVICVALDEDELVKILEDAQSAGKAGEALYVRLLQLLKQDS